MNNYSTNIIWNNVRDHEVMYINRNTNDTPRQ